MANYEYVKNNYDVNPVVGARVRHTELTGPKSFGTIVREHPSQGHRVMVKFDGQNFSSPCHPTSLEYLPSDQQEVE